jgi:hypothetical protein
LAEVELVTELDLFDGWSLKLNTSPYTWETANELDITQDVISITVMEKINGNHTLDVVLRNTARYYTDTESDYFLMNQPRAYLTMGTKTMKLTVLEATPDVKNEQVTVQMVSSVYDLKGSIAQIRVQSSNDGNFYLEDVIWKALFDTGMHNFFLIKLQDDTYYDHSSKNSSKTKIEAVDDIVYTRVSVYEILEDICSSNGCLWYESDLSTSDQYSILNFVKVDTDYEAESDKILYVSTANNTEDIKVKKGFSTVSNLVYYDELPFFIAEHESMDRYGIRNPRMITFEQDSGDAEKYVKNGMSLCNMIKDPLVSFPLTVKGLTDVGDLDKFVKIVDSTDTYDKKSGIDRNYRINSIKYDLVKNRTTFTVGNTFRKVLEEKLSDLTKTNLDTADSNEKQLIGKGSQDSNLRFQVYTEGSDHSSTFTEDSDSYGVRIGIDKCYSSNSPNAKFYFEDDGIRTGN